MSESIEDIQRSEFLAEAEALAQLMTHPAWPRYEALLNAMRAGVLELVATARSQRRVAMCQGAAAVLQELLDRPHQIVATGRQIRDAEAEARDQREALDLVDRVALVDDL